AQPVGPTHASALVPACACAVESSGCRSSGVPRFARLAFSAKVPDRRGVRMARITVEDCLEHVANRFELVLVAARRTKQLLKGARPLVESDNKEVVTALREIAASEV